MTIRINELQALAFSALLALAASACSDDEPLSPYAGTGGSSAGGSGGTPGGGGNTTGGAGGSSAGGAGGSSTGGTSGDSGVAGSGGAAGSSSGGAAGSATGGAAGTGSGGAAGSAAGGSGGVADGGLPPNVAYPGAPPTMLHQPYGCSTNCLSCHGTSSGTGGAPATPHPERLMCRQCHLPQANVPLFVGNTFGQ